MKGTLLLSALLCAGLVAPALAQTVSQSEARGMLFPIRGTSVAVASDLSAQDQEILRQVVKLSETQMRQPLVYYGSIAYSPDEGLVSEALQSSANHHGVAAADRAALAACNAARKAGTQECRIGARILPRRYEAQDLELSLEATRAFREVYRGARGERALAISPLTGYFAVASGNGATARAEADCNAKTGTAQDCRTVIAD